MKLSSNTIGFIRNVVSTAEIVKIDSIIIEPDRVRAIDDNHTVFIFHTEKVPALEVGSIGLTRIGVFNSRFDLGKNFDDFTVEATVVEGTEQTKAYARSLTFKATGMKVEYRCAHPELIRAPKSLNDEEVYAVRFIPETVTMMQKGQSAMSAEDVTIMPTPDGVVFEMTDINADKMTYRFADAFRLDDEDTPVSFTHTYPLKTLLPLLKASTEGYFVLTSQGILKVMVNGLSVYVMPRA